MKGQFGSYEKYRDWPLLGPISEYPVPQSAKFTIQEILAGQER